MYIIINMMISFFARSVPEILASMVHVALSCRVWHNTCSNSTTACSCDEEESNLCNFKRVNVGTTVCSGMVDLRGRRKTRKWKTRCGRSDSGKRGTQNAGLENARMSTMENQNPLMNLMREAYVCGRIQSTCLFESSRFILSLGHSGEVSGLSSSKFTLSFLD